MQPIINKDLYNRSIDLSKVIMNVVDRAPYEMKTFALALSLALVIAEGNKTQQMREVSADMVANLMKALMVTMEG